MQQIFRALSHMHANKIMHRDIKPENIMFETKLQYSDIKIIDFGLANKFQGDKLKSIVGTPLYTSPNVLDGEYTCTSDCWSAGVIMFNLLTGDYPFLSNNKNELYRVIQNDPHVFSSPEWKYVSYNAKALINKLLVKKDSQRLTAL